MSAMSLEPKFQFASAMGAGAVVAQHHPSNGGCFHATTGRQSVYRAMSTHIAVVLPTEFLTDTAFKGWRRALLWRVA